MHKLFRWRRTSTTWSLVLVLSIISSPALACMFNGGMPCPEDCVEDNGKAQCQAPSPQQAPAGSNQSTDRDYWFYTNCSYDIDNEATSAKWCAAANGRWLADGNGGCADLPLPPFTYSTGYTDISPMVPTATAYVAHCSGTVSHTGWGITLPTGDTCKSGATGYQYGLPSLERRRATYVGRVRNVVNNCIVQSTKEIIQYRSRTIGCPVGYTPRTWPNGTTSKCYKTVEAICPKGNPVQPLAGTKLETFRIEASPEFDSVLVVNYSSGGSPGLSGAGVISNNWAFAFEKKLVTLTGTATPSVPFPQTVTVLTSGVDTPLYFGADGIAIPALSGPKTRLTTDGATRVWTDAYDQQWRFDVSGRLTEFRRKSGHRLVFSYTTQAIQIDSNSGRRVVISTSVANRIEIRRNAILVAWLSLNSSRQVVEMDHGTGPKAVRLSYQDARFKEALTSVQNESSYGFKQFQYDHSRRVIKEFFQPAAVELLYEFTWDLPNSSFRMTGPLGGQTTFATTLVAGVRRELSATQLCPGCGSSSTASTVYDQNTGYPLRQRDFRGESIELGHTSLGQVQTKIEGRNLENLPNNPPRQVMRTTATQWHPGFQVASEVSITNNITGTLESVRRFAINTRGQVAASCQIDPADISAMAYQCGSQIDAPPRVRQTLTDYCDSSDGDLGSAACPIEGFIRTVNGPRVDAADVTTRTYYATDASTCASSPDNCPYRKGDVRYVDNALGQRTEFQSYNGSGRVLRQKDANGTVTDFTYHSRGWLLSRTVRANPEIPPNGVVPSSADAVTTLAYESYGEIKRVVQPDGSALEFCRDRALRVTAVVQTTGAASSRCNSVGLPMAGSEALVYTLDRAGNRIKEETLDTTGALKRVLARQYNQLSQLRSLVNAADALAPNLDVPGIKKTTHTYDGNGNPEVTTNPLGRALDNDYDPLNRLIRSIQDRESADPAVIGENNVETSFEYDARDNLRKVIDPKGLPTEYAYDGLSDQVSLISPDTGTTIYTYDSAGNRKTQTDQRNVTATYGYDALNRLRSITYPTPALNVTFNYDSVQSGCSADESFAVGRLTEIIDETGKTWLCYDRRGNVRRKTQVTWSATMVVQYRYNAADKLIGMTYPSGLVVDYVRDAAGRVNQVSLSRGSYSLPVITSTSYLPFGPISSINFGTGSLTKEWDRNYWPDAISSAAIDYDFTTNDVGSITGVVSVRENSTQNLEYDRLDRLNAVKDQNQALIESFAYDATGNRTEHQIGSGSPSVYSYSPVSHRLNAVGAQAREHDANGNTVRGHLPPLSGQELVAVYDDRNRLADLEEKWGAVQSPWAAWDYNGRGERVATRYTGNYIGFGLAPNYFVFDERGQLLVSMSPAWGNDDDSGSEKNLHDKVGAPATFDEIIWLNDTPVARVLSTPVSVDAVYSIMTDHLNTPRALVNAQLQAGQTSGTVVWRWKLNQQAAGGSNAFGARLANEDPDNNGTLTEFQLRFPGQQYDANSGLHYNYFRDYEPGTGRYVESDPIGLAAGVSTYGYALQNPLLLFDPNGLRSWYCQRPLCPAGTNCTTGERGPPVTNHQYLCATRWDGSIECGGQSSDKPTDFTSPGRPTRPDEDAYNPNSCDQVDDDKDRCLERCLLTNFKKPRPTYGIGPQATDCQEWADDTLWGCQVHCRNPKNARKFLDL